MTLQDLRDVLSEALDVCYRERDARSGKDARIADTILLLTLLDEGVRKTMEKRAKAVEPWPDM